MNHSWKNRLRVGVTTSAKVSPENLEAKSLRNGRSSATPKAVEVDGSFWVGPEEVSGSPLAEADVLGVRARSIGRNSAGPVGLL